MTLRRRRAGRARGRRAAFKRSSTHPRIVSPNAHLQDGLPPAADFDIDDPLTQFHEERVQHHPAVIAGEPRPLAARSPGRSFGDIVRAAGSRVHWAANHSRRAVRWRGVTAAPLAFLVGIAVGALGMWAFAVPATTPAVTTPEPYATSWAAYSAAPAAEPSADPASLAPADPSEGDVVSSASARTAPPARREPDGDIRARQYTGSLAVHSGPQGARAFVNGAEVGPTPVVLRNLPVGSRVVRLEADGYQPWSAAIQITADQQTWVRAKLDPAPGRR
jgi:hypothetical protein